MMQYRPKAGVDEETHILMQYLRAGAAHLAPVS